MQSRIVLKKRKINFLVETEKGSSEYKLPRWKEVEVDNANCPNCGEIMVVIFHTFVYAFCVSCKKYFIGE